MRGGCRGRKQAYQLRPHNRQNPTMSLSAQQALHEAEQLLARSSYGAGKSKKRNSSRRRDKQSRRQAVEEDYSDFFMQPVTNEILNSLPNDLLYQSLTYLWRRDMLNVSLVCKELHNVVAEVAVSLFITYFGAPHPLHMTKPSIFSMVEKIRQGVDCCALTLPPPTPSHTHTTPTNPCLVSTHNSQTPCLLNPSSLTCALGSQPPKTLRASCSGRASRATTRSSIA